MSEKKISTEEYYIASIDLLGGKMLINEDDEDNHLNHINNIYHTWKRMSNNESFFPNLKIKFFSDNVVIAQKCNSANTTDTLLEFVSYMAEHLLCCGYKPRGAICKGKLCINDTFVWGKGLVKAYLLESKEAINPRIILDSDVVSATSSHLRDFMIYTDKDGKDCLHYMKGFGSNAEGYLEKLKVCLERNLNEIKEIETKLLTEENPKEKDNLNSVLSKLQALDTYLNDCKSFWKSRLK